MIIYRVTVYAFSKDAVYTHTPSIFPVFTPKIRHFLAYFKKRMYGVFGPPYGFKSEYKRISPSDSESLAVCNHENDQISCDLDIHNNKIVFNYVNIRAVHTGGHFSIWGKGGYERVAHATHDMAHAIRELLLRMLISRTRKLSSRNNFFIWIFIWRNDFSIWDVEKFIHLISPDT